MKMYKEIEGHISIKVKEQTTIDYEGCPSADDDPADHYIITGKAVQIA